MLSQELQAGLHAREAVKAVDLYSPVQLDPAIPVDEKRYDSFERDSVKWIIWLRLRYVH